jgi:hypothetical protein
VLPPSQHVETLVEALLVLFHPIAGIGVLQSSKRSSSISSRQQLQLMARPRAAADAAAGDGGGASSLPQAAKAKRPQREMSMQQRWRAFKFAVQEALQRLR